MARYPLTQGQREALVDSLRAGVPFERACRAANLIGRLVRAEADRDEALSRELEAAEAHGSAVRNGEAPLPARPADVFDDPGVPAAAPPPEPASPSPPSPDAAEDALPTPPRLTPEQARRWAAVREHAAVLAPGLLGTLLWLDEQGARQGIPAMSPWWRWSTEAFYASGKRWGLWRVGRGGGKSTQLEKIVGNAALFVPRVIPPGQVWIWPFISASSDDADRRIRGLQALLGAAQVEVVRKAPRQHPTLYLCDAAGNAIALVALASTIAGVSGPSAIGATIDEEAKLRDRRGQVNPSTEILASLIQTFRGRDGIQAIRCSSAFDTVGSHYQSIEEGDTEANHVARIGERFLEVVLRGLEEVAAWERDPEAARRIREYARTVTTESPNVPTWLANPTIPAVVSRREVDALPEAALEGVPRWAYWLRENASLSMPRGGAGVAAAKADQWTGLLEWNRRLAGTGGATLWGEAEDPRAGAGKLYLGGGMGGMGGAGGGPSM